MPNPTFEQLATTTLRKHRKELADNITGKQALMIQLKKRGFMEEEEGALTLVESILYAENSTVGSYRDWDYIDVTPQDGMTGAEFPWCQLAGSIMISGRQEFINSGNQTRIINLLSGKIMQTQKSMRLLFNRQAQGDGTGNFGKDITGLAALVEEGSVWSTIGGIDSAANQYWRNQWIAYAASGFAAIAADYSNTAILRRVMTTLYNSTMREGDKPTLILTDQLVHEAFESTFVNVERYVKDGKMADSELANAGFENLYFKTCPVVMDDDMPNFSITAGSDNHEMIFLNSDYLKFKIGKGKNFVVTPFVRPPAQDGKVAQILFMGNFVVSNRQRQGRITDIDFA